MRARHRWGRALLLGPVIGLTAGALVVAGSLTARAADRTFEFEVTGASLGWGHYQSAYSERNDVLWVTASSGTPPIQNSSLLKVDPDDLSLLAQYDTPMLTDGTPRREAIYGVAVDDEHNTVWTTVTRENGVAVYSQSTGAVVHSDLGKVNHSRDVVVDEKADRAYVSANFEDGIAVFDTATYQRVDTISTGADSRPMSLELVGAGDDAMLYTTDLLTGDIYAIDTSAGTVRTIETDGNGTSGIAVDTKRSRAYIANQFGATGVDVIDLESGERLARVSTPAGTLNADYDATNDLVYVTEFHSNKVVVIDPETMKQVGDLEVGGSPNHVTSVDGTVYVVDKGMGGKDWADQIWKITADVTAGPTPDPTDTGTPTPDPTDPGTPTPDPSDTGSPTPDPTTPTSEPTTPTPDPTTPTPDPTGSASGAVDVSVSVPATGGLTLSVAGGQADLGKAALSSDLSAYRARGSLPGVTVTDLRSANPGWSLTGQVSDLTSGSYTINGEQLGWTPKVSASTDGQGVTAGSRVRPGTGLAAPKVLASAAAGRGTGTATVGADLSLSVPSWARGGTYAGVITITVA